MKQIMQRLQTMSEAQYSPLIRVLFALSSPSPLPPHFGRHSDEIPWEWFNPTVNESQKEAVLFALASPEVALIHGPPGVGSIVSSEPRPRLRLATIC